MIRYGLDAMVMREDFSPTSRSGRGMGIDGVMVMRSPYVEESPYLYEEDPYFAQYPYGQDYDVPPPEQHLDIFPSFPSCDSTTRVYYYDQ